MKAWTLGLLVIAACGDKTAAPAPTDTVGNTGTASKGDVTAFQQIAGEIATRRNATLRSWGTAELDEHPGADFFAVIEEQDFIHYLVEADGARYLISCEMDGKTEPWNDEEGPSPPAWTDGAAVSIDHQQAFSRGFHRVELAIRGALVVVLRDAAIEDSREDDTEVDHDYAGPDNTCAQTCPAASPDDGDVVMAVTNAVHTVDELLAGMNAFPS
jgi:hypothetical protein